METAKRNAWLPYRQPSREHTDCLENSAVKQVHLGVRPMLCHGGSANRTKSFTGWNPSGWRCRNSGTGKYWIFSLGSPVSRLKNQPHATATHMEPSAGSSRQWTSEQVQSSLISDGVSSTNLPVACVPWLFPHLHWSKQGWHVTVQSLRVLTCSQKPEPSLHFIDSYLTSVGQHNSPTHSCFCWSDASDFVTSIAKRSWAERVSGLKSGIKSDAAAIWTQAFKTEWERNIYRTQKWLAGFNAETDQDAN